MRRAFAFAALALLTGCSVRPPDGAVIAAVVGPPLTAQDIARERAQQASNFHSSATFASFPVETLASGALVRFRCSSGQWAGIYQDAALPGPATVPPGAVAVIRLGTKGTPHRILGEVAAERAPRGELHTYDKIPAETAALLARNYDIQGQTYMISCRPGDLDRMQASLP